MKFVLSVWLTMTVLVLSSQQDSIPLEYSENQAVLIQDTKFSSTKLELQPAHTFSDQLTKQSSLYIRSYGKGSLATLSLRGGTSQHTQLQWDGLPIQNPMLGLADLSLVTSSLFSSAHIYKGGQSTYHGSGAICGVIEVKDDDKTEGGQARFTFGSFGSQSYILGHRWQWNRFSFSTKATWEVADNDFAYLVGGNERIQPNAHFDSKGLLLKTEYNFKKGTLSLSYWLQDIFREIPPTSVQNLSMATQDDLTRRIRADFETNSGPYKLKSTLAYMDEDNNFTDPQLNLEAKNNFQKWLSSSTLSRFSGKTKYEAKLDLNHTIGNTDAYDADQNNFLQAGLYSSVHRDFDFVDIKLALRSEWNNLTAPPLLPNLTINHRFGLQTVSLKLTREYRVPGLNDLYWRPGGNPALRPERGWNQELTLRRQSDRLMASATLYHRKLDDWILWLPSTETGFISAINIAEVRSRGVEVETKLSGQSQKLLWQWNTQYHHGRSTHLQPISAQRIQAGDQLIYTPLHTLSSGWQLQRDAFSIQMDNRYTSAVRGINTDVDGYYIADATLVHQKKYKFKKTTLTGKVSFSVNNLFDNNYRVIERRPMPGRNFTLSINFNY